LFGKIYAHGIWAYFPVAMTIKLTLGSMGLLLVAGWAAVTGRVQRPREVWFCLAPAGVYLWVAMGSQLNIGMRHVLPILPFLLLFAAGGVWALVRREAAGGMRARWAVGLVAVLVVAHVASSVWAYPRYLPYANEAWGGSSETYHYLTDSSSDWGQQLHQVSDYLRKNNIHQCWFAYFVSPYISPADYGIPCRMLPTADTVFVGRDFVAPPEISGVVVMSASGVTGYEFGTKVRNPYQGFVGLKPDAEIEDGVLVYHGTFAVPLAAALEPVLQSQRLLKRGNAVGAEAKAKEATGIAPNSFDAWMQLGKSAKEAGDSATAAVAYGKAMVLVGGMEPSAQEHWRPVVAAELAQ
jgi:hypothetical protein